MRCPVVVNGKKKEKKINTTSTTNNNLKKKVFIPRWWSTRSDRHRGWLRVNVRDKRYACGLGLRSAQRRGLGGRRVIASSFAATGECDPRAQRPTTVVVRPACACETLPAAGHFNRAPRGRPLLPHHLLAPSHARATSAGTSPLAR